MSDMHVRPMETLGDALAIAEVRNTGSHFMTHDQELIQPSDQARWFLQTYQLATTRGDTYAFIGREDTEPVAYGLVNRLHDSYWLTGVITPESQGKGYGRALFEHLGQFVLGSLDENHVMLDVLSDNTRAVNLYKSLGYVPIKQQAGLITMELIK